jgi:hypothetical protein
MMGRILIGKFFLDAGSDAEFCDDKNEKNDDDACGAPKPDCIIN